MEDVYLCRLVVVAAPAASFAFAPTVRVSAEVAASLTRQDCCAPEIHTIRWAHARRGGVDGDTDDGDDASHHTLRYTPCDPDSNGDSESGCHGSTGCRGGGAATMAVGGPELLLRLRCPLRLHVATSVTLSGPRLDARATAAHLAASLRGSYVCVGARVQTRDGRYVVAALDVKHGYGGVAVVSATCQVKLNTPRIAAAAAAAAATTTGAAAAVMDSRAVCAVARPVAVDDAVDTLLSVLRMSHARPGTITGVLVRGPAGCGVTMLVRYCLHVAAAHVEVLPWHPRGLAAGATAVATFSGARPMQQQHSVAGSAPTRSSSPRVAVLLVRPVERYFAAEAPELAAVAMRKLMLDVASLAATATTPTTTTAAAAATAPLSSGGSSSSSSTTTHAACTGRSVVVLATSHHYATAAACELLGSLFRVHIALTLPDAEQRAQLLSTCRGGDSNSNSSSADVDCRPDALALAGKTSREVIAYARRTRDASHRAAAVPFRPVRWSDIGGLRDVKAQLHRALVWPQRAPEAFARFGLTPPKGVLLYGPPGCAKTTLVKALCSEGHFTFRYLDSASVVSAYIGESERYLRDVFARAAQQAPCIVFFDEVEVLGARRGDDHDAMHTRLLSTLLTEMDGFVSRVGVCFVGATNVPHLLDPALLRPGRFDYLVYVPLPSEADRADILHLLLRHTAADIGALASLTHGFSGADLRALCSSALLELLAASASCVDGLDAAADDERVAVLRDAAVVTRTLCDKACAFPRCQYDVAALEQFRREHGGGGDGGDV